MLDPDRTDKIALQLASLAVLLDLADSHLKEGKKLQAAEEMAEARSKLAGARALFASARRLELD